MSQENSLNIYLSTILWSFFSGGKVWELICAGDLTQWRS